jgi:hypothetical protein
MPTTSAMDRLAMTIQDLNNNIKQHPAEPYFEQGTSVNNSLKKLQELLLHRPAVGPRVKTQQKQSEIPTRTQRTKQAPRVEHSRETREVTTPAPRVGQLQEERNTRNTRSNTIHGIGTIVRKRFHNGKYYEGEVINYDTINKYYKVRFKDRDLEDLDKKDMKQYYKQNQQYSGTKYRDMAKAFSTHKYNQNFDFTLFPSPKQAPKHKALTAGGCVWDEELHNMAHYRNLIVQPNPVIQRSSRKRIWKTIPRIWRCGRYGCIEILSPNKTQYNARTARPHRVP